MMKRGHDVESAPSIWRRRTAMEHYAGIDVSLELSSVCVVDAQGKIVKEAKVASEPEAVVAFFEALGFAVKRIGLEAGPLSQWLHAGLKEAGFETVLLETRHVKAALSAMTVKTDRKDARGFAQLLRMGWFQQVHAKSMASREVRALLVGRKQLLGRLIDVELSIRGILRGFGLKVGAVTRKTFEARIRELVTGQATLERIAEAMLSARAALKAEYEKLHQAVLAIVREDAVCRRLMTVPSVGPLVAITYKSAPSSASGRPRLHERSQVQLGVAFRIPPSMQPAPIASPRRYAPMWPGPSPIPESAPRTPCASPHQPSGQNRAVFPGCLIPHR